MLEISVRRDVAGAFDGPSSRTNSATRSIRQPSHSNDLGVDANAPLQAGKIT
jgi:hypothetical protein